MEPHVAREQFARHLSDESQLLAVLEQQLLHEHELLRTNDIEGLEKAGGARQQTVAQLLRLDDQRRAMCRAQGLSFDANGLAALLAWCDPSGTLATAQGKSAAHAQRCREQNERNGALVTARLKRVSGMLGMIAGDNKSSTYQPRLGVRAQTFQPAGRMVSTSA